jgi:hypothetical protein
MYVTRIQICNTMPHILGYADRPLTIQRKNTSSEPCINRTLDISNSCINRTLNIPNSCINRTLNKFQYIGNICEFNLFKPKNTSIPNIKVGPIGVQFTQVSMRSEFVNFIDQIVD